MISLSPQLDFARRRQSSVRRCSPQAVLSPRRQRRRAFTLIEILAVLGVILILMALFFGGMKKWSESSKRQLTVTRLEML